MSYSHQCLFDRRWRLHCDRYRCVYSSSWVPLAGKCKFFLKWKCAISCDYSRLLFSIGRIPQVSLEIKVEGDWSDIITVHWQNIHLAFDGLTVVIVPYSSSTEWNHETAQFYPVLFDDQAHICRYPARLTLWGTRTRRLVSEFPTSRVDRTALSPDHSLADRLIAVSPNVET